MFLNYLKVAIRNLRRHKVYSTVNILGLAVGIAFCVLTILFVRDEWRYDGFHEHQDSIHRVLIKQKSTRGDYVYTAILPLFLGPALKEEIPEVAEATRLQKSTGIVSVEGKVFEEDVLFAGASFLKIFSFPLVRGDAGSALIDRQSIVLSEAAARKYFGSVDVIGEVLSVRNFYWEGELRDFKVTGVVASAPENTSVRFDFLIPFDNVPEPRMVLPKGVSRGDVHFMVRSNVVYVRLRETAYPSDVTEKLAAFIEKHKGLYGLPMELQFQPLSHVHLDTRVSDGLKPSSDPIYSYILAGVAFAVLLIACINFVNLSVGLASTRAREIGVRKIVGALRIQLMRQFWWESILMALLAFLLGIAMAEFFLPVFNRLTERNLVLNYDVDGFTLLSILGLLLFVGLSAGGYPALVLSGFRPVDVLKNRLKVGGVGLFSRALVVLQFAISISFVICMIVMGGQINFLTTRNLGFDDERVVVISSGKTLFAVDRNRRNRLLDIYRWELTGHSRVQSVTGGDLLQEHMASSRILLPDGRETQVSHLRVDYDFLRTLQIELADGRNFSPDFPGDKRESVILNESLVKLLELESPVDKPVPLGMTFRGSGGKLDRVSSTTVIGVVKDFHYRSLRHQVEPLALFLSQETGPELLVRIDPENQAETLAFMRSKWEEIMPNLPFEATFLDEYVDRQYRADQRWGEMIRYASLFALFVACLGAFGLTSLAVSRRTKEIGIRKVLGASAANIVQLLSREFVLLVVAANILAWPVAYYAMDRWLQDFAYRVQLGPGTFLLGSVLALGMVLLTVSTQAFRAALKNPVEALRYE